MSVRRLSPNQPSSFAFQPETLEKAKWWIAKFPAGRQQSAVIPILWLIQKQEGWVSEPAIRLVAEMLGMARIRVLEVATFYTMFMLEPVGSVALVQVCGTTPCMLRGSDDVMAACKNKGMAKGKTTPDGLFTLTDMVMPIHRVQAAILQTGPVRQRFGWYHLKFTSLASDASGETDHSAAPCASLAEIEPILEECAIRPAPADLVFPVSYTHLTLPTSDLV